MTDLRCEHCDHIVHPQAGHCLGCGAVREWVPPPAPPPPSPAPQRQLLAMDPGVLDAVRQRHPPWQDRAVWEAWTIRNAELVMAGAICSGCGSMMSANKQSAGRPTRCIVCASGYGPMSTGRKRRAPARPKSLTERNMEILDGR